MPQIDEAKKNHYDGLRRIKSHVLLSPLSKDTKILSGKLLLNAFVQ